MNTKTMRLPPRRFLTPNKRKEPDGFTNSVKPSITTTPPLPPATKLPKPTPAVNEPAKSNQLIAGYLAHEFLSKGTLFGQPFDPESAGAEVLAKKEKVVIKEEPEPEQEPSGEGIGEPMKGKCERYVEISGLLKREGAHIEGIVNPTQLRRLLQM